ncbi:MAG: HEAT repeat domain-containing protein [Candidatus Latescibacterota bacterium]|nr:HEAT repeat domain-containing protein [Candidatus Latescibacterota bacterium]
MRRVAVRLLPLGAMLISACEPSIDNLVDDLAHEGSAGDAALRELLLSKDRAVPFLLEALRDPDRSTSRPQLVRVLASLTLRVADAQIPAELIHLLESDPNSSVRVAVANAAGYYRLIVLSKPLLVTGAHDSNADVRHQSLRALRLMAEEIPAELNQRVCIRAAELLNDGHRGVREEAAIRAEELVGERLDAARGLVLKAQEAQAESVYLEALQLVPDSKRANYRLARLFLDRGDSAAAFSRLRDHGLLLDVPVFDSPPMMDGRIDDTCWQSATRVDGLYQYVGVHRAALPSEVNTELFIGRDRDHLYVGFIGHDDSPADLLARTVEEDVDLWRDDIVEIYLDANLDHRSYVHIGINSAGVKADAWHTHGLEGKDQEWDADLRLRHYVGDDRWSLEVAFRFGEPELSPPVSGQLWGFNFVRTYRGSEYSQWVRTYGRDAHSPDDFGLLRFH